MSRMFEQFFLSTTKVLKWIESILTEVLNEFEHDNNKICCDIKIGDETSRFYVSVFRSFNKKYSFICPRLPCISNTQLLHYMSKMKMDKYMSTLIW